MKEGISLLISDLINLNLICHYAFLQFQLWKKKSMFFTLNFQILNFVKGGQVSSLSKSAAFINFFSILRHGCAHCV